MTLDELHKIIHGLNVVQTSTLFPKQPDLSEQVFLNILLSTMASVVIQQIHQSVDRQHSLKILFLSSF